MKELQENFTTIEQSKRLLELGVPAWTADCFHTTDLQHNPIEDATPAIITYQLDTHEIEWDKVYGVPCWSVGRLIEIYCLCVDERYSLEFIGQIHTRPMNKILDLFEYVKLEFSKLEE
jgi:hypothetical protein